MRVVLITVLLLACKREPATYHGVPAGQEIACEWGLWRAQAVTCVTGGRLYKCVASHDDVQCAPYQVYPRPPDGVLPSPSGEVHAVAPEAP